MRKKPILYTELCYALGILILALGTAFTERADLGMSMVVAPAYVIHLKLVEIFPFYSFGMSEYVFQALLIMIITAFVGRFKRGYAFSFATAVIYGFTLDAMMALIALIPVSGLVIRIVFYAVGLLLCSVGVALFFNAYIPPEAYELFVKEVAQKSGRDLSKVKLVYDIASCVIAVALSFAFFGFGVFRGVSWGTAVCALVNGPLIGVVFRFLMRTFDFRDAFPKLKAFFG